MAWTKNGTPSTLGAAATTIEISDLTGKKFNQYMYDLIDDGTNQILDLQVYNSETGNLFASRGSSNGGADATDVSRDEITTQNSGAQDLFGICYSVWISGEEKLTIGFSVGQGTAGAAGAPNRSEYVGKYVPSPLTDTFDVLTLEAQSSGEEYESGSNLSALGTD